MEQENQQNKKCPFCAEEILFDAVKCKHCGEWLNKQSVVLKSDIYQNFDEIVREIERWREILK